MYQGTVQGKKDSAANKTSLVSVFIELTLSEKRDNSIRNDSRNMLE